MLTTRIIRAPRPNTVAMLLRRTAPEAKKQLADLHFDAIGLIQTDVPSLFYFADIAQKAGNITAAEIVGNCPQHINTMAFFGNNEAVNAAIAAIQLAEKQ
jgi:hypothetical protein